MKKKINFYELILKTYGQYEADCYLGFIPGQRTLYHQYIKFQLESKNPFSSPSKYFYQREIRKREYSYKDIAKLMNITHTEVKEIEKSALDKIKAYLQEKGYGENDLLDFF